MKTNGVIYKSILFCPLTVYVANEDMKMWQKKMINYKEEESRIFKKKLPWKEEIARGRKGGEQRKKKQFS